jgi:tetratricopeptide (TPR) repeat protein
MSCAMGRLRNEICLCLLALISAREALANALPQFASNTVTVSGMVLTEGDNQRIEHVTVRLCDTGGVLIEETNTSDSGEFVFRGVQRGRYILTFEANGFQKAEVHQDLSFASDKGMSIYLKPVTPDSGPLPPGTTISAHELSMPEAARELVDTGRRKLYSEKNAKDGLKDFQQAVSVAPSYYEAYRDIAVAQLSMGSSDEAIKSFRKSIEVSHDSYGDADVGLGTLLVEKGDLDAGEKAIRRGVELNPNSWMGFFELGKLDLNRNRLGTSLQSAERARMLSPNTPMVYRLLANIHLRQKDYEDLLGDLDAYLKLDPDSPAGVRAKEMRGQIQRELAKSDGSAGTKPHE